MSRNLKTQQEPIAENTTLGHLARNRTGDCHLINTESYHLINTELVAMLSATTSVAHLAEHRTKFARSQV